MNKITLNHIGHFIENFDMNGYNIVGTSLTWSPFMITENCNESGRNCKNSGIAADFLDSWAKSYNFTWDIYADVDNNWGIVPEEGPPYNIRWSQSFTS